jgi:DNA-directed RNA polymerase specialized sigma24 family protein
MSGSNAGQRDWAFPFSLRYLSNPSDILDTASNTLLKALKNINKVSGQQRAGW